MVTKQAANQVPVMLYDNPCDLLPQQGSIASIPSYEDITAAPSLRHTNIDMNECQAYGVLKRIGLIIIHHTTTYTIAMCSANNQLHQNFKYYNVHI